MRIAAAALSAVLVLSSIPDVCAQTLRQLPAQSVRLNGAVIGTPGPAVSGAESLNPVSAAVLPLGAVLPAVSAPASPTPIELTEAAAAAMTPTSEPGGEAKAESAATFFFDGAVAPKKGGNSSSMALTPVVLPVSAGYIVSESVLFPDLTVPFVASNQETIDTVLRALKNTKDPYLVVASPDFKDGEKGIHRVASLVRVSRPDLSDVKKLRVNLQVVGPVVITGYQNNYLGKSEATLNYPLTISGNFSKEKALMEKAKELALELEALPGIESSFIDTVIGQTNPAIVASMLAQELPFSLQARQEMLAMTPLEDRYWRLFEEMRALSLGPVAGDSRNTLQPTAPAAPRPGQPAAPDDQSARGLKAMIDAAGMPAKVLEVALREVNRLAQMNPADSEAFKIRTYLQWLVYVPWSKRTVDNIDMKAAKGILDRDHSGLEKVKDRVMEYLAVRKRTGAKKGTILCFSGPPGVGKTSIASAIAEAMGRKFARLSLGGIADETELRGHGRTYLGSQPGALIAQMRAAGTVNPVILLDEVDKIEKGRNGDPMAALLEILDPQQNNTFRDHYMEVPYDLSEVLFIVTANDLSTIPAPLRDRMEIIEFTGYTVLEKVAIAENHVVPEKRKANGLTAVEASLSKEAIRKIVEGYTMEAGVRTLRATIDAVLRKVVAWMEIKGDKAPGLIEEKDVEKYLGVPRYNLSEMAQNGVGVGTGLAVNQFGGSTLNVEVVTVPGRGQLVLRQQMLKMTNDSAHNAYAYVKSVAKELGIAPEIFEKNDLEMQFSPAHDIDGPSAGSLMATTIASRLTGRKVKAGVAMTGEITLTGRVLPIGGLMQKVMAAQRMGFHTVIFPAANLKDVESIPKEVRDAVRLVAVKNASEVFAEALEPAAASPTPTGK